MEIFSYILSLSLLAYSFLFVPFFFAFFFIHFLSGISFVFLAAGICLKMSELCNHYANASFIIIVGCYSKRFSSFYMSLMICFSSFCVKHLDISEWLHHIAIVVV